MTDDTEAVNIAGDYRRAAAAVAHYGQDNFAGINEVMREASEAGRGAQLLVAVLGLYDTIVPELHTPLGMDLLSSYVYRMAGMEQGR